MTDGRRTYVYLMALASGVALLFSAVVLVNWAGSQWAVGALLPFDSEELAQAPLSPWLWIGALSLVLWLIHAGVASRTARQETAEGLADRRSSQRKAYLYLMQLAALIVCLAEGGRLVSDLLARFLRQPGTELTSGPTALAGSAAGLAIGFATWAYFRRMTLRDGDYGQEEGRAAAWRRLYFYLAIAAGVALTAFGAVQLLRVMLSLGGELVLGRLPTPAASRSTVVAALTAMALGMPLAVLAWHGTNQVIDLATQAEVNAPSRVLLLRSGAFFSTLATLLSLIYVLWQLFAVSFGRRMGIDYIMQGDALTAALAIVPVAIALWLASAGALQNDAALAKEARTSAAMRRAHFYLIAAACLAGSWYGVTQMLRAILPLALDAFSALEIIAPLSAGQLSLAAALLLIATPAWWGHWWPLQVRAGRFTADGFEERASVFRQAYLYVAIVVASGLIIVGLGLIAFTLIGGRVAASDSGSAAILMSGALAVGLVALASWVFHVLTLRSDRQTQLTWVRVQPSLPEFAALNALPEGPRSFSREELARLKVETPPYTTPGPAIAVVDGGNGAFALSLIEALRAALPEAVIMPYALTAAARRAMEGAAGGSAPPGALGRAAVIIAMSDDLAVSADGEPPDRELQDALKAGNARVLLLPPRRSNYRWVGAPDWPPERWITYVVGEATHVIRTGGAP